MQSHTANPTITVFEEPSSTLQDVQTYAEQFEQLEGRFDAAIVMLTGGMVSKPSEGDNEPQVRADTLARYREAASGNLYWSLIKQRINPVLIISGGRIYKHWQEDKNHQMISSIGMPPSLAEVSARDIRRRYRIEDYNVIEEPFSMDTAQNAIYTNIIIEALGLSPDQKIYVVTNNFHLDRAQMLFDRHCKDHKIIPIGAESYLEQLELPRPYGKTKTPYTKAANNLLFRTKYEQLQKREDIYKAALQFPFGEQITTFVASRQRSNRSIPNMKEDPFRKT